MLNPLPNLDDRRWADLVEEGRALIPLYSQGWTDHNAHDPGITFMEMFAAVAEMDIFQLNRVPDRHKRKFLALVGIEPLDPQPSRTVLSFQLKDGAPALKLDAGTELATTNSDGTDVVFRLADSLTTASGSIDAILVAAGPGIADNTQRWIHGESIAIFGTAASAGACLYIGLSKPLPVDAWTKLYFDFGSPRSSADERRKILEEADVVHFSSDPRLGNCI